MSKLFGWFHKECGTGLEESEIQEIRNIVLEEAGFRWIPVSERLPEDTDFYLVTLEGVIQTYTDIIYFDKKENRWKYYEYEDKVLSWRPRPKPYDPQP